MDLRTVFTGVWSAWKWVVVLFAVTCGLPTAALFLVIVLGPSPNLEAHERRCAPLIAGIEAYRKERGAYPETLKELSPRYVEERVLRPLRQIEYDRSRGGYQLYLYEDGFIPSGGWIYRYDGPDGTWHLEII